MKLSVEDRAFLSLVQKKGAKNLKTCPIDSWETPATSYPVKTVGSARIVRRPYRRGIYLCQGANGYDLFEAKVPLSITGLRRRTGAGTWKTWMVDDPPQWWMMQKYARESSGYVLVGGLGLGLVVHELVRNPKVTNIVVAEADPDVIRLVGPLLPSDERLSVCHKEFQHYALLETSDCDPPWSRIIVDLWVGSGEQVTRMLREEAIPLAMKLGETHPGASLAFHGFGGVPEAYGIIAAQRAKERA